MNNIFNKITDFIKSFFGKQNKSRCVNNPWAGLSSYEDPQNMNKPLKFCGRDDESLEVFNLIDDNIVITLYGKSGIGKTSLLNAGVFPILRQNNYMPLYVRLGVNNNAENTFAEQIVNILTTQIEEKYGKQAIELIDVIPENTDKESDEYLWSFFARRKFRDIDGNIIFPVIVLDQFEETIRINRQQTTLLLKQIAYMSDRQNMLKETIVNKQYYIYNYNFRFVLSIREDDLYILEDFISTNYLSSLRNGRYRLQNLSVECAMSIVRNVGAGLIEYENIDRISERIINVAKGKEDGLVQTNVISLVCSRLFDLVSQKGKNKITLQHVESYLSIDPFEDYYAAAVNKLSESEKRFIETRLVSTDGRRNMLYESVVKESVKSYNALIEGNTAIFHRIRSSEENYIELIHDGLCPIVQKQRMIRLEKKNKTMLSLCLFIIGVIGVWMLNTSVINNFVNFWFTITGSKSIIELRFSEVLAVSELLFIILSPIAIGSVIYDYGKKKIISKLLFVLFFLPSILYLMTNTELVYEGLSLIKNNYNLYGISYAIQNISRNTYVFIVYAIAVLILSILNFWGESGIKRNENFIKILWSSRSVWVYLLFITVFLFYKSIINNGHFIIDSFDSSWGILIIPVLTLKLFRIKFINKRNWIVLFLYVMLLSFWIICSIKGIYLSFMIHVYCLIIAFFILIAFYYENNFTAATLKSLCNVVIIALVMFFQGGYNPIDLSSQNIYKVYPWKIIIKKNTNTFGIYDAIYGDTLLIPEFYKDSISCLSYYTSISSDYTDTITGFSVGNSSIAFPLTLEKMGTGKWKLSLLYSPNYEYAISNLAHSAIADTINLADKEAANLYIKLRNDISKFCISGNNSILLSDIPYIKSYEKVIEYNLGTSIHKLSQNRSIMTEDDVVPFIKALSRSIYMNMLKEAILKGHYNDFIGWYSNYYIATSLTKVTLENGIRWSRDVNYSWNLSLNTENFAQSNAFKITLEELNNNKLYAWNNLFYALFTLEVNSYAPTYYSEKGKILQNASAIIKRMRNNTAGVANRLKKHKYDLQKLNKNLGNTLTHLTALNKKGEKLDTDEMVQIIKTLIYVNNISKNIKNNVSDEIISYDKDVVAISENLNAFLLQEADIEFENFVLGTFKSLMDIINKNPVNAYNGMFISLCQKLYVIGIIRGYDMTKFAKQLENIEKYETLPIYNFVKKTETVYKNQSQMLDSIQKQMKSNHLNLNQLLEKINNKKN